MARSPVWQPPRRVVTGDRSRCQEAAPGRRGGAEAGPARRRGQRGGGAGLSSQHTGHAVLTSPRGPPCTQLRGFTFDPRAGPTASSRSAQVGQARPLLPWEQRPPVATELSPPGRKRSPSLSERLHTPPREALAGEPRAVEQSVTPLFASGNFWKPSV